MRNSMETARKLTDNLIFLVNRLRYILSQIDFDEISVSQDEATRIEGLYKSGQSILEYLQSFNPQKRLNLAENQQILYNEIIRTVKLYEEE